MLILKGGLVVTAWLVSYWANDHCYDVNRKRMSLGPTVVFNFAIQYISIPG